MLDLVKKGIYLGLGTFRVTREKVESLVDELIEKGQLSTKEKPRLVKELMDRFEQEEKDMSARIKKAVEKTINEMGLATRKDTDAIAKRIEGLEKKVTQK